MLRLTSVLPKLTYLILTLVITLYISPVFAQTNPPTHTPGQVTVKLSSLAHTSLIDPPESVTGVPIRIYKQDTSNSQNWNEVTSVSPQNTSAEITLERSIYKFESPTKIELKNQSKSRLNGGYFLYSPSQIIDLRPATSPVMITFDLHPLKRTIIVDVKDEYGGATEGATIKITFAASNRTVTKTSKLNKATVFRKELDEKDDGSYSIEVTPPSNPDFDSTTLKQTGSLPGEHHHTFVVPLKCYQRGISGTIFVFCGPESQALGKQTPIHPSLLKAADATATMRNSTTAAQSALCYFMVIDKVPQHTKSRGTAYYDGLLYNSNICHNRNVGLLAMDNDDIEKLQSGDTYQLNTLWHELGHAFDHAQGAAMGVHTSGSQDYASRNRPLAKTLPAYSYVERFLNVVSDSRYKDMNKLFGYATTEIEWDDEYWRKIPIESFAERYRIFNLYEAKFTDQLTNLPNNTWPIKLNEAFHHIRKWNSQ